MSRRICISEQTTDPNLVRICPSGFHFRKLFSVEDLYRTGVELRNCLAEPLSPHVAAFRDGSVEIWALYDLSSRACAAVAVEGGVIIEAKGISNSTPSLYREELRTFIVSRGFDVRRDQQRDRSQLTLLAHPDVRPASDLVELGLYGSMARYPNDWCGSFMWRERKCLVRFDPGELIVQFGFPADGWLVVTNEAATGMVDLFDHVQVTFSVLEINTDRGISDILALLSEKWPRHMQAFSTVCAVAYDDCHF